MSISTFITATTTVTREKSGSRRYRLTIPRPVRDAVPWLRPSADSNTMKCLAFAGSGGCVQLDPMDGPIGGYYREVEELLQRHPLQANESAAGWMDAVRFFQCASVVSIDQGDDHTRFTIPRQLRDLGVLPADTSSLLVVCAVGTIVEIWRREAWQTAQEQRAQRVIPAMEEVVAELRDRNEALESDK